MESLLVVSLITMVLFFINLKKSLSKKIDTLQQKQDQLLEELKRRPIAKEEEVVREKKPIVEERRIEHKAPEIKIEQAKPVIEEKQEEPKRQEVEPAFQQTAERFSKPVPAKAPVVNTPPQRKPNFFERNPDLEKFIGENLANKIGIAILVLGVGFFVKYAIDQNWINEIGRVFIGILCGGALLGVAHYLRKTFVAFSSVLVGGGIAVLYLTIAIAFHEYNIFNQTTAFILMLGITGFAVALSLGYNRIELAVVSLLGGFASPFMVSTGEGNYIILFSYILILDSGMLVLAYFKKWNLVNIICYVLTVLLFASWLGTQFDEQQVSMITGALTFATLFYLVFFAMNIVNNVKERLPFKAIEITILLSNTFLFYAAGMALLTNEIGQDFRGLFTAILGVFNFVFAYTLYKNSQVDKNLVFLLIGLVLTFVSLAAPVQLEGNYITLFWSAEAVLLLWLSQKSGIRLMKLASVIVTGLMFISLLMDWDQIYMGYEETVLPIVLNKAYITGLFSIGSILGILYLLKKEDKESKETLALYKSILMLAVVVIGYTSQLLELRHQLFYYDVAYATQNVIIGTYNVFFIMILLFIERRWIQDQKVKEAFSFWGIVAMLSYLFYYHDEVLITRYNFLFEDLSTIGFLFHYVLIALLIVVATITLRKMQLLTEFNRKTKNAYSWFYVFFFVFLASAELDHLVVILSGTTLQDMHHVVTQNHKIGYPILWGITSFLLIAIGLKMKKRHLRIISLTLFLITIIKLFTVDIQGISEGGKIAAFISLGVLLLIVSFMYQRLKKILLADEPAKEEDKSENKV